MKKRILAMLLTVCMLVLAVPVFVLPTTAAEEPAYSTSFNSTTNLPTVSGGSVTFNGNWSFVNYGKIWDGSRDLVPGEDNPYSDTWCGPIGHANWDGALTCGGKFGFINYGSTNEEKFGPLGAMGAQTCTCPGKHINPDGTESSKYNATGYPTLVYTAEKTGVIDIYFDKLGNAAELTEGEFTYLVYVNNELVKTYTLTAVAGEENWIYESKTLAAGDLEIKVGQKVLFMVKGPEGETDAALNGGNVLFPTIEYTSTDETFMTSYSDVINTPKADGGSVKYSGNWTVLTEDKETGNGKYEADDVLFPITVYASGGSWAGLGVPNSGKWGWGTTYVNVTAANNGNYQPRKGGVAATKQQYTLVRYTAEKSGTADIAFDELGNAGLLSGNNGGEGWGMNPNGTTFTYTVYINGTKVWPLNGETNSVNCKKNASMIYTSTTPILEGITLNAGDRVDFVCESDYNGDLSNDFLWGAGGNVMFSTIKFTSINNNIKVFDETNNLPTYNADGTVTFNGNFYGVGYVKGENGFTYNDPDTAILMTKSNALWSTGAGITAKDGLSADLPWNNCASLMLTNYNANYFQKGWMAVTGKMSGAIRYVAEETGVVDIAFNKLGNSAPLSKGVEAFNYYVYVNGVKVWSSADSITWATDANGNVKKNQTVANVPVATNIELDYGDVIDFVVEGKNLTDADLWNGAGNVVNPMITWTKVIPKPITNVNVAMGSSFALNANVEIPVGVLADVTKVGFTVNGEEVEMTETGLNTYAIYNILKAYAQDLAAEDVTIQAYYKTATKTIYGTEITTNILEVIQAYVNGKDKAAADLAVAVLNYVTEAQLYFDPTLTPDELANAVLTEDQMLDYKTLDYTRYDDTLILENEDATVEFGGVSMILNSATALKFYIELPEGADVEDYVLLVADPASMEVLGSSAAMTVQLKYTENGNAVAYFGSTFENMDRLYAFAIADATTGAVVSDILVYSPLAYAASMANDLEVGYVCSALIALNDAIDAYTGAVATR